MEMAELDCKKDQSSEQCLVSIEERDPLVVDTCGLYKIKVATAYIILNVFKKYLAKFYQCYSVVLL